ncbi:MAG: type I asparaginase [Tannerellaceae bacterium]|jgi:L-asparaginase|nr:type I asparaginase [Tannerellaceae bacterium]
MGKKRDILGVEPSILLVYTGGTIGMTENAVTGSLEPFEFKHISDNMPELKRLGCRVEAYEFMPPVDSADMGGDEVRLIASVIERNYNDYDGFVVLHGTDTMAYTASTLSFMLEGLGKAVVFTGSQLPIGKLRTDGRENLITAIEIAAAFEGGRAMAPEVTILFDNVLYRGNRTSKVNTDNFRAFQSPNFPPLATAGVTISYNTAAIRRPAEGDIFKVDASLDGHIVVLRLFPGIPRDMVGGILGLTGYKGVVMETYGSGNAPSSEDFIGPLRAAVERGVVIVNVTQCLTGSVAMERYETGRKLLEIGVLSGYDMTTECAVAKMMCLTGRGYRGDELKARFLRPLAGEFTI